MVEGWYERSNCTWGSVLARTVERQPDAELILHRDRRVTYAEFHSLVEAFARGLLALGVRRGENTALWMTNRPEWMVAQFAAYEIGSPLVPLNTRWSRDEIAYALRQSDASTLVLGDRFLGEKIDAVAWLEELVPEISRSPAAELRSESFPRLSRVICLGADLPRAAWSFDEVLETGRERLHDGALRRAVLAVNPFDVANIIYTSGTTGAPKGGMSMHRNNLAAMLHFAERADLRPDDRMYLGVPFATNFGCAYVSQLSVLVGNAIVVHETFNPTAALEAISRERVSWFPGAPTMYVMMLADPALERCDLRSLRAAIVGGAPCPPHVVLGIRERLGAEDVIQCYGLSECGGLSTSTRAGDVIDKAAATVGTSFPSATLRLVDPASGLDARPGETGEIWLRDVLPGSCLGKGYYGLPDKTAEALTADGWFRTGDLGTLDGEGYLSIVGRLTDMFIVGGFNAYPAEIETVLGRHPKVKMAQVFGVPDKRLGEVGFAAIELRPGENATEKEIITFCREHLAGYKIPRRVRFLTGAEFPLTSSGKVKKFLLRERLLAEFEDKG